MSSFSFNEKVIAISGAASGIGRATARLLAAREALLSLADINESGLNEVAIEIQKIQQQRSTKRLSTSGVLTTVVDVRSQESVSGWIDRTTRHFGQPLAGAANLAGVIGPSITQERGMVRNISNEEFDWVMDVNVKGTLNCLRAQLPALAEGSAPGSGSAIVNASSISGLIGVERNVPYVAAKHAIVGITKTAAKEEGRRGIRVNAVAPGLIATPMLTAIEKSKGSSDLFNGTEPGAMARRGDPDEAAEVIIFLLSPQSSFVNGAVVPIDGGWVC